MEPSDSEYAEEYEDDLAQYQDMIEEQVCNEIMNFRAGSEGAGEAEPKEKEISEEERQARQMKLKNARKYFQVLKLTWVREINAALGECANVRKNHQEVISQLLSRMNRDQIDQFVHLSRKQPLSIQVQQIVGFLRKVKGLINISPAILLWSLCEQLKVACRKVHFFDLQALVEETFYKLNYHILEKDLKKQAKRRKETQLLKIQIDLKRQEEEMKENKDYLHFQDFEFDHKSFRTSRSKSEASQQQSRDRVEMKARRENNYIRKRNYKWAYFQIFSPAEQRWRLVNSQLLEVEEESEFKTYMLTTKPIIGFYSCRLLHFKQDLAALAHLRTFQDVVVEDLSMYFFDNWKHLQTRRKRVGARYIMKETFEQSSFYRNRFLLSNYDQHVMECNDRLELQFQLENFPKSKQELLTNNFFVVPSTVPQYAIIDQQARPIEKQFGEEKVFLRRDIVPATSRMVWIDRGRKVKQGQQPVKKTQNKSKNMSQLFLYQQTEPFHLSVDQLTGNFQPDDNYNSIYVPAGYVFAQKYAVITESIGSICTKNNFRHVKIVQGFTHTMGKILPNYIGFLVYREDQERVMELWQERQEYLKQRKSKNREKYLMSLWNKLFTKIELDEWSNQLQR